MAVRFSNAIVRKPGIDFSQGITTGKGGIPDYPTMLAQHQAYSAALRSLGLEVNVLEPLSGFPDAYFVEDAAILTSQVAVITHPGASERRGEVDSIATVLSKYRRTVRIEPPGTLEGGDVLMVESHFLIGVSARTNQEGARQLGIILEEYGCTWTPVPVGAGLHLKSSVNYVGKDTLLVAAEFDQRPELAGYTRLVIDSAEEYAANILFANEQLIIPMGFPKTRRQLASLGFPILELEVSEARKMDGGLTCMSLRF